MNINLKHVGSMAIAVLALGVASTFVRGQSAFSDGDAAQSGGSDSFSAGDDVAEPEASDSLSEPTSSGRFNPLKSIRRSRSRSRTLESQTTQDDAPDPYAPATNVTSPHHTAPQQGPYFFQRKLDLIDVENSKAMRESVKKLRAADDADTRQAAAAELTKLLETAFDRDYERRNNELAKLEERVTKLRAQLDRRKESRNDIIDVRVKSLLYEAEGIGFPADLGGAPVGSRISTIRTAPSPTRGLRRGRGNPLAEPIATGTGSDAP